MEAQLQALLTMMKKMEGRMEENRRKIEDKLEENQKKNGGQDNQKKIEKERLRVEQGQVEIAQKLAAKLEESHRLPKEKLDQSQQVMGAVLEKVKKEMEDKAAALTSDIGDPAEAGVGNLKTEVEEKIETLKAGMERKVHLLENRLRTVNIATGAGSSIGSKVQSPTFDGKAHWKTYPRQFEANYWTDEEKATALILALREETQDTLQTIPESTQTELGT